MYKLTPRMLQRFKSDIRKYHDLFDGGRCSSWEQEELIVNAIKSDTTKQHHVFWREAGHDDKADIKIRINGDEFPLQVKSGQVQVKKERLMISGHRLGRFNGCFKEMTEYLNKNSANIISVSYRQVDNDSGRHHYYHLRYIDIRYLTNIDTKKWEK